MQVYNLTRHVFTGGNICYMIRKPMVIVSKSLLRHPEAVSAMSDPTW